MICSHPASRKSTSQQKSAGFAVAMEGGAQSLLPLADAVAPAAALDGAAAAVREYLLE